MNEHVLMDARSVITVISFLTFVGIILWAWSGRRKADFEQAENLPFADDAADELAAMEKHHG